MLSLQISSYCETHHSQRKRVYYYIAMACNIPRILKDKCTTPFFFGPVISAIQTYYIVINLLVFMWLKSFFLGKAMFFEGKLQLRENHHTTWLSLGEKITDIQYNTVQCIETHRLNSAYFHN